MNNPPELSQRLVVDPALTGQERDFLAQFAGAQPGLRRLWPTQPGARSPWLPCAEGCCLLLDVETALEPARAAADPTTWLRFLIRELLAPQAAGPVRRTSLHGLPGGHRLDGRVLLGMGRADPRLVTVTDNRVRERALDDDLFPRLPARDRTRARPAAVVELDSRRRAGGQSVER